MQPHVLHFPMPDPSPQPQPIPHPEAPPFPSTAALPMPMVHVIPAWTYRHVQRPLAELATLNDSELNALGADGWELTGVVVEGATVHFFYKRPSR